MNSREECAFHLEKKNKTTKQDIWLVKIIFSDFQKNWMIDLETCLTDATLNCRLQS